jgi:hypothetical protein
MRAAIFIVAIAINELAQVDLSSKERAIVILFFMFLSMDLAELTRKLIQ